MPKPAEGLAVNVFATGLDHPRWLYVLPNGDVLVAETNTPKQEEGVGGIKGMVMGWMMKRAGAGVPSPNRIMLLRDADGDGVAETKSVFLKDLNSPFGMALIGDKLYVADSDALLSFDYKDGATEIAGPGTKVADLPAGPHQLSLDEEPCRVAGWIAALCGRRVEQQCRRERARLGKGPRADPGDRSGDG